MVLELSHLTGRFQSVSLDGYVSDSLPVNIGVPQWSVLGSLLFLHYLNNFPTVNESCNIYISADDTDIDSSGKPGC